MGIVLNHRMIIDNNEVVIFFLMPLIMNYENTNNNTGSNHNISDYDAEYDDAKHIW